MVSKQSVSPNSCIAVTIPPATTPRIPPFDDQREVVWVAAVVAGGFLLQPKPNELGDA